MAVRFIHDPVHGLLIGESRPDGDESVRRATEDDRVTYGDAWLAFANPPPPPVPADEHETLRVELESARAELAAERDAHEATKAELARASAPPAVPVIEHSDTPLGFQDEQREQAGEHEHAKE